jgi:nucleoporin NDC1
MSLNITQTISSPVPATRTFTASSTNLNQPSESERECWSICRDRFKYVIFFSVAIQYILLMLYSIIPNVGFLLHPVTWAKEIFSILLSPLILVTVIHGYFTLKPFLEEKVYLPTRMSKFIRSFTHESSIIFLNFFIGLFTSLLFVRYLSDDMKTLTTKTEDKKFLNEKFAFLLLNGAFMRCYFYFKRGETERSIAFPIIHQSKFLQLRRQIVTVLKASFVNSLIPVFHFIGFYIVFGGSFCYVLRRVFGLSIEEVSFLESFATVVNVRLLVASWILSSMIWSNMELMGKTINIFTTEPREFSIEGANTLTLAEALSMTKFQITQQLAAQDLYNLADNPISARRKQYYALSNPGGHPHNWKRLVQNSLAIINNFSNDLKSAVESISKNRNNNNTSSTMNQPIYQFYENKRMAREFNDFNGVRSLASSTLNMQPTMDTKQHPNYVDSVKQKLMANRFVRYFLGETEEAKLNFLLIHNSQTIEWITQGISSIVARSISEDSYGVVQHDIRQIVKSLIKLKNVLDKVGSVNSIAKDRNFIALKAAVRRSLYRIVAEFSRFFEDLLLDSEDIRALHAFATFKEL